MYGGRYGHWMNPAFLQGPAGPTGYILTDYANGLAGYSFRKLEQSAIVAIRVREDGLNTEADIGFNGNDLDEAAVASHCGVNNGFVVKVYDQSGNSYNIDQATAIVQPQIYDGSAVLKKNLKPGALLDGNNDFWTRAALTELDAGNPFSYFAVTSLENTAGAISAIWTTGSGSGDLVQVFRDYRTSPTRNFIITASGTNYFADYSTAYNTTDQVLQDGIVDAGGNMSAFDNGNTGGTNTYSGTYTNDRLDVGRRETSLLYLDGYFQELILFSADMSADRADIDTNINNYYSIY